MVQKFYVKLAAVLLTTVLCAHSTFCWDEVGHKLTAYIAWDQMAPEVRERVFKILLSAPENSDLNVHYNAFNSRSNSVRKRELFMFASIWPDVIRDPGFEVRNKTYNHANWHYGDIFWKQEGGRSVILKDFDGQGGLAVSKLYDFEKTLRDPNASDAEKAIVLAWFLHVGGDIHNPLHNASRVTDTEPKGDQGGNLVTLRPGNQQGVRRINLHGYWDSIIQNYKPRKNDACDIQYLVPIAKKMMKKFPYSRIRKRLKLNNYKHWSIEGFNLLSGSVYTSAIVRNQLPSEKYRKRAFKTAQEQIALAGYRLGETLNQIFGKIRVKR